MTHGHPLTLVALLSSALLAPGCDSDGGSSAHVSPCEETLMPTEPFVAYLQRGGEQTVLDFDGAQVQLGYSDRPGDEACVFEARMVFSKGGPNGCTLTLETGPFVNSRDELLVQRVALSVTDACPSWGITAPASVERTVSGREAFGYIGAPDLVDEDDSCYAGEVDVVIFETLELSVNGELLGLQSDPGSYFVDAEASPQSLPCAMR